MTRAGAGVLAWPPGLVNAVSVLHEILVTGVDGRPAVPSAGAIHPYELVVLVGTHGLFRVDPARRRCVLVPASADLFTAVWSAGLPEPGGDDAHVVVLTRPWLSMRKYGLRGHDYCQLDGAHLAVDILGAALSTQAHAALRVRPPRPQLRRLLGDIATFREIHSVVSLTAPTWPPTVAHTPTPIRSERTPGHSWRLEHAGERPAPSEPAGGPSLLQELETLCWSRVPASADVQAPARDIGLTRLVAHPGCIVKPQDLCTGWRRLSRRRRSSRSFRPDPLPRALVDRTVAGTQIPLPIDLTGEPADVRVTVHQVRNTGAAARERVVEACLGQEYLGDADTFVVFHASREATSPMHRSHARTEALVRAGGAAQLIYLSATALDVGVTAVGGFRPRDWAEMARVPADDDVLYLMALGSSGSSRTKVDRHAG